jgi:hypothetical protein
LSCPGQDIEIQSIPESNAATSTLENWVGFTKKLPKLGSLNIKPGSNFAN